MQVRTSLFLPLRRAADILDIYVHRGGLGAILVPPTAHVALGDEVDLELALAEEEMTVHTRGTVAFRMASHGPAHPEGGIGIELATEERRTRDLLLELAEGRATQLVQRRGDRLPAQITVVYRTDSVFLTDVTDDVSHDGALIRTNAELEVGEQLELLLKPPGIPDGITVAAEVVWRRDDDRRAVGVRFRDVDAETRSRIDALMDGIHRQVAEVRHSAF